MIEAPRAPSPKAPLGLWNVYYGVYEKYLAAYAALSKDHVLQDRIKAARSKSAPVKKDDAGVVGARPQSNERRNSPDKSGKAGKARAGVADAAPKAQDIPKGRGGKPMATHFGADSASEHSALSSGEVAAEALDSGPVSDDGYNMFAFQRELSGLPKANRAEYFEGRPTKAVGPSKPSGVLPTPAVIQPAVPTGVAPVSTGDELAPAKGKGKLRKQRPGKTERARRKLVKANPTVPGPTRVLATLPKCASCDLPLPASPAAARRELARGLIQPLIGSPSVYICQCYTRRNLLAEKLGVYDGVEETIIPYKIDVAEVAFPVPRK